MLSENATKGGYPMAGSMTYKGSGVSYLGLDGFKRLAQSAAATTAHNIQNFGIKEVSLSRGESVYLIQTPFGHIAFLVEGLGTKNLVADALINQRRKRGLKIQTTFYDHIGHCLAATILNDMATSGVPPLSLAMHLAVGDAKWFSDRRRVREFIGGWTMACNLAGCTFGPGETPALPGMIMPEVAELSGAGVGWLPSPKKPIVPDIHDGDAIVMLESSGVNANGLSLARRIADKLPDGFLTKMSDGREYGEALLDKTNIYTKLVERCLSSGVAVSSVINITGHGWRKLMRDPRSFRYHIMRLPSERPIFRFMKEQGPVAVEEMYGTFNMGADYALYVHPGDVSLAIRIARELGFVAFHAGTVRANTTKDVFIEPLGLRLPGGSLAIR